MESIQGCINEGHDNKYRLAIPGSVRSRVSSKY